MVAHPESPDLVFVHLSDIHFRQGWTGDFHDEDRMLRNELQIDLRRLRGRIPQLNGLLISGDIAFGAQFDEYAYARGWVASVCELLECPRAGVMVTPGNHDINRALIPNDGEIDLLHQEIRAGASQEEKDERLAVILRDPARGELLLSPLSAYNKFAEEYDCAITPAKPFWERDFKLKDGTILRFRGITTTFLSSPRDHHTTHRMLYGGGQRSILRDTNVRHAVMGHHPSSWAEGDTADQIFSVLTSLQIFGHKHEQWIFPMGNSVRVIAGAVHPSRAEQNWNPRYSAIAISAVDERHLAIRIYPRCWSREEITFIGDCNLAAQDYRDYTVNVEPKQP